MLLNNVDSSGQLLGLAEGIHQVKLFNLETQDPYDLIRIIGSEGVEFQWRYNGETDWRSPYSGNEFTEYADSVGQQLRIELNVISGGEFLFRTDDTYEYPNDDAPTNPIIDIEVLPQGSNYYSTVAEDYLGAVDNNILSTGAGAIAAYVIQQDFFHGMVDLTQYGVEGTAALWVTEPGINLVSINYDGNDGKFLLWDGSKLTPVDLVDGENELLINTVSDEWGFVLLDADDAADVSQVTINSIQWLGFDTNNYPQLGDSSYISLSSLGDVNQEDLENNVYEVATGTGDRAASTLGYNLVGNRDFLTGYGTEGSYVLLQGLEQGLYDFAVNFDKIDLNNVDSLYTWNGKDLTLIADTTGIINTEIEVMYGNLAFIGMDAVTKTGTTEFIITDLTKTADLPYELITLNPSAVLGDIRFINEYQIEIGTGTGDRAASTLGNDLMGDRNYLKPYGTEGSYLITDLENGVYEFDVTNNKIDLTNNDSFWAWNGKDLVLIATNENGLITNSVDVIYGELSFIAMDSTTTTGTTEFILSDLTRTGDLSYTPPTPISLTPDVYLGDIDFYENQTRINNGTGDRAISTLSNELGIDLSGLGTEGSYGTWLVDNGIYEITYYLYTSEDDFDHDTVYFYDGNDLSLLAERSQATIQSSATRWISDWTTQQVEVTEGELTILTLDTVDKSGTTQLRIGSIERIGDLEAPTNEPEQTTLPVSWGDITDSERSVQGEFLGEILGVWNDPSDSYSFYVDDPSVIRFEVQEVAATSVGFEAYYENELVSDGLIMGDTIEFDVEAGEVELKLFMTEPATSVEYDIFLEAISIPSEPDPTPSDLGVVGTGVNGNASGFIYQDEYIGDDDSMDMFTFNSTDATFEFTLWAGDRSLGVTLSDDAGIVAQFLQYGGKQTYTWNLLGDDANYLSGDHTLIIQDLTGDGGSGEYDFALWQGGDSSNGSQQFPTSEPLLDPLTGYPADPHTPIYSEPPYPIPDTGRDLGNDLNSAWNMGTLKPWETDSNTGITWNNGYVYGTYHLGHSYITDGIGAGDTQDWVKFTLEEESYINLFTPSNATTELLDSNLSIIGTSPENNNSPILDYLMPGDYYLKFSTASGLQTAFSSNIYLSNSDPYYAD